MREARRARSRFCLFQLLFLGQRAQRAAQHFRSAQEAGFLLQPGQQPGLNWLRPYDLRHTAITRMAEAGVPIHVIMSFAGHMSAKMQLHYTSISMASKREWAQRAFEMPTWEQTAQALKKPSVSVGIERRRAGAG
jgi:integrase